MKRHRITVEKGDSCITDVVIMSRQAEGWYEYIPKQGDRIKAVFKDKGSTVVREVTSEVTSDEVKRISLEMPSDLDAGDYTYDVSLTYRNEEGKDEVHTICDDNIFIVKEDERNA